MIMYLVLSPFAHLELLDLIASNIDDIFDDRSRLKMFCLKNGYNCMSLADRKSVIFYISCHRNGPLPDLPIRIAIIVFLD